MNSSGNTVGGFNDALTAASATVASRSNSTAGFRGAAAIINKSRGSNQAFNMHKNNIMATQGNYPSGPSFKNNS